MLWYEMSIINIYAGGTGNTPSCTHIQYHWYITVNNFNKKLNRVNPWDSKGNYSATSNNTRLLHWPLTGGLLYLIQRGGAWAGCGPAQSPPRCTKCNSPPITVLLYEGLLLCGFQVVIKELRLTFEKVPDRVLQLIINGYSSQELCICRHLNLIFASANEVGDYVIGPVCVCVGRTTGTAKVSANFTETWCYGVSNVPIRGRARSAQ